MTRRRGLTLPPGVFDRQLAELRAANIPAAITFDDGDRTSLAALKSLSRYGFQATQFLVADRIGKSNDWDATGAPLMDDADVCEWLAAGHTIGSHTLTHARLTKVDPARAREEIVASKRSLEDRFGVAVEQFAYPWGDWNFTLAEEVARAGYRGAFTIDPGVNTLDTPAFARRRFPVWCALRNPRQLWLALTS
jgi:peptidoglycan/xylan/chitin deacetylase (PgdA/CDA1 family)